MTTRMTYPPDEPYTLIARRHHGEAGHTDEPVGFLTADGRIYFIRWNEGLPIGRVDAQGRVFRDTQYAERELGAFTPDGQVHSHGLFEGGALGWLDPDGTVVQAGLIFGEEEVGFVQGPQAAAAAAALLLIFLPDAQERQHAQDRG